MKSNLVLLFFTLLFLTGIPVFSQKDTTSCSIQIENFINSNWIRKSKKIIADSDSLFFTEIESCLIGKSKQEIIELFGKPNEEDLVGLSYYIEKKPSTKRTSKTVEFWFDETEKVKRCMILISLANFY